MPLNIAPSTMPSLFVKRAVSPLEAEPITVASEDVLCPGSDDEDSEERRRSKRRRIEVQGQKYLEGKPLFILSAGLRGPLEQGWVNPFKKKPQWRGKGILKLPEHHELVDLTQTDLVPVVSPSISTDEGSFQQQPGTRAIVASNVSTQVSSIVELNSRRARSTDIGKRPRRNGGQIGHSKTPSDSGEWLKTNEVFLGGNARGATNAPSPTPAARRPRHTITPSEGTASRTSPSKGPDRLRHTTVQDMKGLRSGSRSTSPRTHITDINGDVAINEDENHSPHALLEKTICHGYEESSKANQVRYREIAYTRTDDNTKHGIRGAKALSQDAIRQASNEEGFREARRLSQQGALRASQSTSSTEHDPFPKEGDAPLVTTRPIDAGRIDQKATKPTPRALPPSDHFPEFKYKIARKYRPALNERSNLSPFAQELEAAKAREEKKIKHLSFTASGVIRSFGSRSTSRASSVETTRSRLNHQGSTASQEENHRKSTLSQTVTSRHTNDDRIHSRSDVQPQGPEAQLVQQPTAPSGPSTDVLETDKQSLKFHSTEEGEGDSYLGLSTQAAFVKAQQYFNDTIQSPLRDSPSKVVFIESQPSPTAYKTPQAVFPPLKINPDLDGDEPMTPSKYPANTQAMIEAISPFAPTTVKKKESSPTIPAKLQKRASFAPSPLPSPSHTFGTTRRSFSMSTSSSSSSSSNPASPTPVPVPLPPIKTPPSKPPPPSILTKTSTGLSKPPSTATSLAFSIAPNGTLTEVFQQDGQQQCDPGIGMGLDSQWDLDQALEEAGSFLETLDVEAEARKGVRG